MAKKPAASDEESGSGSGAEVHDDSDDTEASEQPAKGASKKTGKAPEAKSSRASQARPAAASAVRSSVPRGSGHELVPVICSECYEELVFDSGVPSPVLTCPICEHQAARPDDAQLAVIGEKRKQEKTGFVVGTVLCLVALTLYGVWLVVSRSPHTFEQGNSVAVFGPTFGAGVAFVACLGFALGKYEGNRHDVYF